MVSKFSSFVSDHNAGTDKKGKEIRCTPIDLSSLPPRPPHLSTAMSGRLYSLLYNFNLCAIQEIGGQW